MTISQSEAEKIARHLRPEKTHSQQSVVYGGTLRTLCDYVLSLSDMKREIENAAFERAAEVCDHSIGYLPSDLAKRIRAIIQSPAQKENGE